MIRRLTAPSTPAASTARAESTARGQSLVEFALFVPVLVLLMLVAVDLGRVYFATVSLHNVARIGANYASQNPEAWRGTGISAIKARYQQLMRNDARGMDCTLPATLPSPVWVDSGVHAYSLGSRVRVEMTCRFQLISPFLYGLVGDSTGGVGVGASSMFVIRSGSISGVIIGGSGPTPAPTASPTPPPTAAPTATPEPTPEGTIDPDATPTPAPTASPELIVSFYGSSTSDDASGGGPPGSDGEDQVVGVPPVVVTFSNTTIGLHGSCFWDFGDGGTSTSCGSEVSRTYSTRGTYTVTLQVQDKSFTRHAYVLIGCKVPAFAGVRKNSAGTVWTNAGFVLGNMASQSGVGNYRIGYQSLAGGLVNPPGGCAASITVGP